MAQTCPIDLSRGRQLFQKHITAEVICLDYYFLVASCPKNSFEDNEHGEVFAVNLYPPYFCRDASCDENVTMKRMTQHSAFLNHLNKGPVTDLSTGISYVNSSVFSCFATNQSVAEFWGLKALMKSFAPLSTLDDFLENLNEYKAQKYVPNRDTDTLRSMTHFMCHSKYIIDSCNKSKKFSLSEGLNKKKNPESQNIEVAEKC